MKKYLKFFLPISLVLIAFFLCLGCNLSEANRKKLNASFEKMGELYAMDTSLTVKVTTGDIVSTATMNLKLIDTFDKQVAQLTTSDEKNDFSFYYMDGYAIEDYGTNIKSYKQDLFEFSQDFAPLLSQSEASEIEENVKISRKRSGKYDKYTLTVSDDDVSNLIDSIEPGMEIDGDISFNIWIERESSELKKIEYEMKLSSNSMSAKIKMTFDINAINDEVEISFPSKINTKFNELLHTHYLYLESSSYDASVSGEGQYIAGDTVTVSTTTLDETSVFVGWFNGFQLMSEEKEYSFIMPDKNLALTAKYEPFVESYENQADRTVTYHKLEKFINVVHDSKTGKFIVLYENSMEIYSNSFELEKKQAFLIPPSAISADNGILAIGFFEGRQIHLYDLSQNMEIRRIPTSLKITHLVLGDDTIVYTNGNEYSETVFYSISKDEIISEKSTLTNNARLFINRKNHIVYHVELNQYQGKVNYFDTRTGDNIFSGMIDGTSDTYEEPSFDGTHLHYLGRIYDGQTGEIISTRSLNMHYNQLENFSMIKTLYHTASVSFVSGGGFQNREVAVYDNINERFFHRFNFNASSFEQIDENRFLAINQQRSYIAILDLSEVDSDFEGNIPPPSIDPIITETDGIKNLKHFESYTACLTDDEYIYIVSKDTYRLTVYDTETLAIVYSEQMPLEPVCLDAYGGKLLVGYGKANLFRVYETSDWSYSTIKVNNEVSQIILFENTVFFSGKSRISSLRIYSLEKNEYILDSSPVQTFSPNLAVNRADGILYIASTNESFYNYMYYYDMKGFKTINNISIDGYYNDFALYFDGEFVHYMGSTYDRKTAELVADSNSAHKYNVDMLTRITTLYSDSSFAVICGKKSGTYLTIFYDLKRDEIGQVLEGEAISVSKSGYRYVVVLEDQSILVL